MPHVIEYACDTRELHVSVDVDGQVIVQTKERGSRLSADDVFVLTPFEAGLLAKSLHECAEVADTINT